MPKHRPNDDQDSLDSTEFDASDFESEVQEELQRMSRLRRIKIVGSVVIVFHLLAVLLPPLAFQTSAFDGRPSPLVGTLIVPFEGYGQFLHMDRGYAFFAPDPGASRLFQAAIISPDGKVEERLYPDIDRQWPRLLYHRHFMLAEYLSELYQPPGPPDELFRIDRSGAELWQQLRARYEFLRQSMVDHLRDQEGHEVAIRRIVHGLPGLEDFVAEPIELNDPRLYEVLLDQPVLFDSIAPVGEPIETEEIPAPKVPSTSEPNE